MSDLSPLERADKVREEIADHDCEAVADDLCPPGSLILTPDEAEDICVELRFLDPGYPANPGTDTARLLALLAGKRQT